MRIYGYKKGADDLIELEEASLECSMEELSNIIKFLQHTKRQHAKAICKTNLCHSHYRDWDSKWKNESTDIIVITKFNVDHN